MSSNQPDAAGMIFFCGMFHAPLGFTQDIGSPHSINPKVCKVASFLLRLGQYD
jgi:hypothetical protein